MMQTASGTLDALCQGLAAELKEMAQNHNVIRVVGFTGPPGAGKSEAVSKLQKLLQDATLGTQPLLAGILPMDGFHKSNAVLAAEELSDLKGTPASFDVVGFLMTLDRAHDGTTVVYAPGYDRALKEPVAASHKIERTGIVLTEGNYLASQDGPWAMVREAIDLLIYLDVPENVTHQRLLERHQEAGKTLAESETWIARVDAPDRLLAEGSRHRADRIWIITEN
ncbi:fructose transporter [Mobiluncus porci]|uniref:Fructose transporter n=1 Tax=Mobiluncus porci TaxID=2652278 RepID=A0A7K0K4H6_9ACTO|nr:fructose transporter [Mobiluncus porci]MST50328.1 fructose transporter [Mobiluncus porci]